MIINHLSKLQNTIREPSVVNMGLTSYPKNFNLPELLDEPFLKEQSTRVFMNNKILNFEGFLAIVRTIKQDHIFN